ncbi:MAG: V-type ATP synthase subunit I [Tissierellia bacterium]|nr:V-type ATP synthase subunit I [Tissierellia bacterium]
MAIVKMDHFNLFAFESDQDALLHSLQDFGDVQFNDLPLLNVYEEESLGVVESPKDISKINDELLKVNWMIDIISQYVQREGGLAAMKKGLPTYEYEEFKQKGEAFEVDTLYETLKALTDEMQVKEEELNALKNNKLDLYPWRDIENRVSDFKNSGNVVYIMGYIPNRFFDRFKEQIDELEYTYYERVSLSGQNVYMVIITMESERELLSDIFRKNAFNKVEVDAELSPQEEMDIIDGKIEQLNMEIEKIGNEIAKLSDCSEELELKYEYLMHNQLRVAATSNFLKTEHINLIEGYYPTNRREEFRNTLSETLGNKYYLEVSDATVEDANVPVLLDNNGFNSSFENITSMYAMPRYGELDPTPLLAPFYMVFFGMMVADVGYGLLLLIGTILGLKLFNLSESMKQNLKFFFYLSFSVILWGFIYGSFFGGVIELPMLIDLNQDYMTVMILSMIFGGIQMFFGLGVKAYMSIRDKNPMDAVYDVLFWYMSLLGLILFGLSKFGILPDNLGKPFLIVAIVGMVGIILFGGRHSPTIAGRLAGGLYELYGISSYIGDFVSYVRLMALGLSGAFLGSAINMIVGMLGGSGIIGIIAGVLVFVIGQGFNLFLSALSAYVHGLRLTYVEFFGKFYEGGGRRYKKFRNKTKYIEIK